MTVTQTHTVAHSIRSLERRVYSIRMKKYSVHVERRWNAVLSMTKMPAHTDSGPMEARAVEEGTGNDGQK